MPPETVEYLAANLTERQKAFCQAAEASDGVGQCRVQGFTSEGHAIVHLHGADDDVNIVHVSPDGEAETP